MKMQIVVWAAVALVISGLVGCNQMSKQHAQSEAAERQKTEADRQRVEAERQHVEEAQQQRMMQPQIDWVKSNLDGHDWSHHIDNGNGTTFNEAENVTADVIHRCSISILERRANNLGFSKKECTINLIGLPNSAFSIEKVDQNGTVVDGARMNTAPYWSVTLKDGNRISCTDTFAGRSTDSNEIDINFDSATEAKHMVNTLIRMSSDSCAQ